MDNNQKGDHNKMNYNLLDKPWINVEYFNTSTAKIGIRQTLIDAENIRDIKAPVFRGDVADIYDVLVYKLLTTIIMAAYFKKENKYAAQNSRYLEILRQDGIYSEEVQRYLAKFEDRFDIFSDTHPFLQNIALQSIAKDAKSDDGYKSWNILVPSGNNHVFGKNRSIDTSKTKVIDQYEITDEEFAYMLLYLANMGRTPMSTHFPENSLAGKVTAFVVPKGKNLADTLLLNILPLKNSTKPIENDEKPDMPVWELNDIQEIKDYPNADLSKNRLLCAFYPGISVLGIKTQDNGLIQGILRVKKENLGLSTDQTNAISDKYFDINAITALDKDQKQIYKEYSQVKDTASSLCIAATARVESGLSCQVLDQPENMVNNVAIYYRLYDRMKTNVLGIGKISGRSGNTWKALQDPQNHDLAVQYQEYYKVAKSLLSSAMNTLFGKDSPEQKTAIRMQSDFFEDDFFNAFTASLSQEDALQQAANRMIAKTSEIYDYFAFRARNLLLVSNAKGKIIGTLNKRKEKMLYAG